MVDSVDNNAYNSLQRIQKIALQNLQANRTISQALVNANQSTAVTKVNASGIPQLDKSFAFSATSKTPLPRGSIVDKLV